VPHGFSLRPLTARAVAFRAGESDLKTKVLQFFCSRQRPGLGGASAPADPDQLLSVPL
jgi:hypothetical protein